MDINKNKLINFINKERKKNEIKKIGVATPFVKEEKIPWFKRPIAKEEFISKKAKNGRWYARHKEWSKNTWIGPYKNFSDCETIIDSYVYNSLEGNILNKALSKHDNIHSVIIENSEDFF